MNQKKSQPSWRAGLTALALGLGLTFSATAQAVEWNHKPDSPIGPNFWGSLTFPFATCGSQFDPVLQALQPAVVEVGLKQTPVDIVGAVTDRALPALQFAYRNTPLIVENTGHVVEVPYAAGSSLRVGPNPQDVYQLLQFHLHAPSEHAVNGVLADAELHLVHRNVLGELAVVGVLLQRGGGQPNPVLTNIILNAPLTEGEVDVGQVVNALSLLPAARGYYTYTGSLTTPPCTEGVHWYVLKQPVSISQQPALDRLHQIISLFPTYEG